METNDKLATWLQNVLLGIVTEPESLLVEKTTDERGNLFTVKVAEVDRGRVIGKKGQTAEAIRTILRVAGFLNDVRAAMVVDIPGRKYVPRNEDDQPRSMKPPYV